MGSLYFRALCSIVADVSMASLCGLLLARAWLRRSSNQPALPRLALPAALLPVAVALQLLALAASFTGQSGMPALMASLPDILSTHPGKVLAFTLITATALFVLAALSKNGTKFRPALAVLFAACLIFRSGSGHSATENIVSLAHALQFLHLAGMAMWSGAVLISGLFVLPSLQGKAGQFRDYVASLSRSSTWAVGMTALAGIGKTWTAVEGNLPAALHGAWAVILIVKIACVCIAIFLGALNRRLLTTRSEWSSATEARSTQLLRAEAIVMVVILIASGLLANVPPPGE